MARQVVFLSSGLSLPRIIKRVSSFKNNGYDVSIYGFTRASFLKDNSYPVGVHVESLGELPDGKGYVNNMMCHFKKMPSIIKTYNKKEDTVFYCMGFLPALIAFLFAKKPYIYEISDLIYGTFGNSLSTRFFAFVDKRIIKKSKLTVMTSTGFEEYLFPGSKQQNILIQPNKLSSDYFSEKDRVYSPPSKKLRFGFVGYLRYTNTVFRFAKIIGEQYPDYSFSFYGDSKYSEEAKQLADKYPNVFYCGKYKSPDDLVSIYQSLDIIVACYDVTTLNERIAEPNKLYEALFFSKPIIVSPGTFVSKRVEELNCGYIVDASTDEGVEHFMNQLDYKDVLELSKSISLINIDNLIDNPQAIFERL